MRRTSPDANQAAQLMDKIGPFQTYDERHRRRHLRAAARRLRAELKRRGLDGFVVPHSRRASGRISAAKRAERLAWLTAFTGSAGAAVVLKDKAAVFVDGRYTLQVRQQTDTSAVRAARSGRRKDRTAGSRTNAAERRQARLRPVAAHPAAASSVCAPRSRKPAARWSPCDSNPIDAVWQRPPAAPTAKAIIRTPTTWPAKARSPSAPASPKT